MTRGHRLGLAAIVVLLSMPGAERAAAISASYDPSTGSVMFMDVVKPPEGFGYQLVLESLAGNLLPGTTAPPYPVPGSSAYEVDLPHTLIGTGLMSRRCRRSTWSTWFRRARRFLI
jgi:hypothetical protein